MKQLIIFTICYLITITIQAQQLEYAEYFFDTDPGFGNGFPIAVEGMTDSVYTSIDISHITPGLHNLYVRAKDSSGCWGLPGGQAIFVKRSQNNEFDRIYYSIDEELDINSSSNYPGDGYEQTIHDTFKTNHLDKGIHTLYFMATTANGNTSQLAKRMFYIPHKPGLKSVEYFFTRESDTIYGPVQNHIGLFGEEVTAESVLNVDMLENKQNFSLHLKGVDMHGYKTNEISHSFLICRPENMVIDTSVSVCNGFSYKNISYTSSTEIVDSILNVRGCDSIVTIHLTVVQEDCNPTNIPKIKASEISIYPNPAENNIMVRSETIISSVKLLSLSGSLLKSRTANSGNYFFNIEGYPKGLYILSIDFENGLTHHQLIEKK
jgi:hypothetical protein